MSTPKDLQYQDLTYRASELDHAYGKNVHILSTPVMMTMLANLCAKTTTQPEANRLISELYIDLLKTVLSAEFDRVSVEVESRMIEYTERGVYSGEILKPDTKVAVGAVARAGILPSQVIFDRLNMMFNPQGIREDCFFAQRIVDENQQVTGADVASYKIGGELRDYTLLLPDPMGATGSSIVETLETYEHAKSGTPDKVITMHLIITPEYIKNITTTYPDAIIYAIRLDRGLSSPEVLATKPGTRWDEEKGLNDVHYIVPGGGGLGELITNSWV